MSYLGDFTEDATVRFSFTTNDGAGGRVAPSSAFAASDLRIFKNGSDTQKTSTNGVTMTSPFDSMVGVHHVDIDTSNDTGDSGFWVTGADYEVILYPSKTVDGESVSRVVAEFSIENRNVTIDRIWNEALTGATHNIATSAGKRLRQLSDGLGILHEGTAQDGGNNTITLAAAASATDDLYHDAYISIFGGTGVGQIRPIIAYDGTTKVVTVSKAWATNPASGSEYIIAGSSSSDLHTIQDSESAAGNLKSACEAYSATRGLAGTALPDAAADAAGGLPISAAGSLLMDTLADWIDGGRLDEILDNILSIVVEVVIDTGTSLPGLINGIVDDVWTRQRSGELASLPSQTTPSHEDMLAFLYEYFRNKIIQNPSDRILYKADDTTPLATYAETDIPGTFTQEAAT